MSSINRDELEEELAVYKRSLERERKARQIAEQELEKYSRKIYQAEVLLKEQSEQVQNKQAHLNFLTSVAEDNWLSKSVDELIDKYLTRSCHFLTSTTAAYFQIEADLTISKLQIARAPSIGADNQSIDWNKVNEILATIDLASMRHDFFERKKGCALDLADYGLTESLWVFLLPTFQGRKEESMRMGCMSFFYELKDNIDLLKFETMEASHSTFSVAIERKKAEIAIKRRVHELQISHQELENIQQQLIESEKLASLGQLSAGVAHEINNPVGFVLSNINSMADYLEDIAYTLEPLSNKELDGATRLKNYYQRAEELDVKFLLRDSQVILDSSVDGLARVKDIVADLNSFARMDSDELGEISVNEPIKGALNILNNELKYGHEVELDLAEDTVIMGNEGQLQQVFINFFMNAKHAMGETGTLTIKSFRSAQRVIVSIQDTGCGIKEEDLKEIFTPFFTTKPQGQGTGLGLSITYSILQRHHAKIDVKSEVGKGTVFILSFVASM